MAVIIGDEAKKYVDFETAKFIKKSGVAIACKAYYENRQGQQQLHNWNTTVGYFNQEFKNTDGVYGAPTWEEWTKVGGGNDYAYTVESFDGVSGKAYYFVIEDKRSGRKYDSVEDYSYMTVDTPEEAKAQACEQLAKLYLRK